MSIPDTLHKLPPELLQRIESENARSKTPEGRYGLGKRVEYRVRPVTRYIVTKYEADVEPPGCGSAGIGGSQLAGEYGNYETAYAVAYALCKARHEELGYDPFDERIQYPKTDMEELEKATKDFQTGDVFA